jgi:hypothetical protein
MGLAPAPKPNPNKPYPLIEWLLSSLAREIRHSRSEYVDYKRDYDAMIDGCKQDGRKPGENEQKFLCAVLDRKGRVDALEWVSKRLGQIKPPANLARQLDGFLEDLTKKIAELENKKAPPQNLRIPLPTGGTVDVASALYLGNCYLDGVKWGLKLANDLIDKLLGEWSAL